MGEATEEDGDYFGDPVIEASRLYAHAGAGQILTTDMVRAIAGRHSTQELATRGSVVLKGLPDPVQVVEVLWELGPELADVVVQLPLPVRLVGTSAETLFAFCGRDNELSLIADVHKRSVAEDRLGVVLVSGEPGMGKTTLVAKAARAAHTEGSSVLYGGAEEDLAIPYRPWVAALSIWSMPSRPTRSPGSPRRTAWPWLGWSPHWPVSSATRLPLPAPTPTPSAS